MSTAGRSRKPDADRNSDASRGQSAGGGRHQPDSKGHGPSGQRPPLTFLPLPQSALSGSHGQRRQARGPSFVALSSSPVPSSSSRSKSQPVLANQPHAAGKEAPTSTSSNGPVAPTVSAWGKGNTVQRLSQQQQGQQQPSQSSPGTANTDRAPSIPTSQKPDEAKQAAQAGSQATSISHSAHPPTGAGSEAKATTDPLFDSQANLGLPNKEQLQSVKSNDSADARAAAAAKSHAQAEPAERADSGSTDKAHPQRTHRRRGPSRSASQQGSGAQSQQKAHQSDRPERQERQDPSGRQEPQPAAAVQQQPVPAQSREPQRAQSQPQQLPPHPQQQAQQPQQQQAQQAQQQQPQQQQPQQQAQQQQAQQPLQQPQQQQRRGQGQGRNRDGGGARQVPHVNLGRAAAEGAAARPPSTPAASEPPRAFPGEVDQTPVGPGTPHERFPTPSTPTPATPVANEPSAGGSGKQGPFAQERPATESSADPASSSSHSSSAGYHSALPDPQSQATVAAAPQRQSHPRPPQSDSSLANTSMPTAVSASAPSMSLTFGSVSFSDIGKPVVFQELSQSRLNPGPLNPAAASLPAHSHLPSAPVQGNALAQSSAAGHPGTASGSGLDRAASQTHSGSGQIPSAASQAGATAASQAGASNGNLPEAAVPAYPSTSGHTQMPQAQASAESASESPVHARTDSMASTSSPGQSAQEGHRRPSSASGRSSQGPRRHNYQQPQQRGHTPSYHPQDPTWASQQILQQRQQQQQQYWSPAAGYEALYSDPYSGYSSTAGHGWYGGPGYGEQGMYDQPGNAYWPQVQQAPYGYEGQQELHPPQQQPRGRGSNRPRHSNPNPSYLYPSQHYAGLPYPSQHYPSHLLHAQQQLHQQHPTSHPLPGQQHVSQQGSRQSSQHMSPQDSPPVQSHPQSNALPRSLSQSSEQAQPAHAHAYSGQSQRQTPTAYPQGAPAYPQAAPTHPQSHPAATPMADPLRLPAQPEMSAMYGQQQQPPLQTPFATQQPGRHAHQTDPAAFVQDERQYQQQQVPQQQREQQPQLQQAVAQHPQQQQPQQQQAQQQVQNAVQQAHSHQPPQPGRAERHELPSQQQQPLPQLRQQQQQHKQAQQLPPAQAAARGVEAPNKVPHNKQLSMQEAEAQMQGGSRPATTQQSNPQPPARPSSQQSSRQSSQQSSQQAAAAQSGGEFARQQGTASAANGSAKKGQAGSEMRQIVDSSQQLQQHPKPVASSTAAVDKAQPVSTGALGQSSQSSGIAAAGDQGQPTPGTVSTSGAASGRPDPRAEPGAASSTSGASSEQPSVPVPKAGGSWASMLKAAPSASPQQPARRPTSAQSLTPQHAQQHAQMQASIEESQHAQQPAQCQADSSASSAPAHQADAPEPSAQQGNQPSERAESTSAQSEDAAQPAMRSHAGAASAEAIQAASASAPGSGLRAPSSLAVGAAVPSTKDTILARSVTQQPGSSQPTKAQSAQTPAAAAAAAAGKTPRGGGGGKPEQPEVPQRSLEGFDEAVVKSVKALCQVVAAQEGSDQGIRLQPRGLKNSGNLCFMNATLQALMAGSSFCAFVDALRAAAPALPPSELPNLYNFSQFARAFPAQPQNRADPDQPQPQGRAVPDQAQDKTGSEQPQVQDDSSAQPLVNGHEAAEEDARSESKADSEVMSTDGKTESVKSSTNLDSRGVSKADAKGASKGSKASSRGASSDGGVDPKPGKAVPKVPSRSHLELAGQAVVPDMMYKTLDIFNPHNAKLLAATAAGGELTMAQRVNRGVQKVAKQREQEDAQEFLTFLLDSTHQELLKLREMYGTQDSASNTSYDENWEHVARKGKSNVTRGQEDVQGGRTVTSHIFGGAVQSTVKAARAKASVTVQPFNLLHLDIQSVNNVSAALQMLTKPEDIHDYKATDESAPVTAKKEIKLLRLPHILVLHMCRFTYNSQGLTKLHKQMQFSLKLRIQQSLLADDCEQRRHGGAEYELIASVSHHGKTPASGHYTADVKQPDGEWLRFDDDYVSHVNVPQVLSRDCEMYLLFYEMKSRT